jgi:hypothetical protein
VADDFRLSRRFLGGGDKQLRIAHDVLLYVVVLAVFGVPIL